MATRLTLRTRVASRTGRGSEVNFISIVNDAFDEFLRRCARMHDFREMRSTVTLAFSTGDYYKSLPLTSLLGFETSIHHILGVSGYLTTSAENVFPVKLKSEEWLNRRFPDRIRSTAISQAPAFAARVGSRLDLQAPASDGYTLSLRVSSLPLVFANDVTSNPIPSLDEALVRYGTYMVYESVEAYDLADRNQNAAVTLFSEAVATEITDPAEIFQHEGAEITMDNQGYHFSLSNLQGLYPE